MQNLVSSGACSLGPIGVRSRLSARKKGETNITISIGSSEQVCNAGFIPASDMFIYATRKTGCLKIPQPETEVHVKAERETAREPLLICGS